MLIDWLPSWWTESEPYLFLTGPGRWLVAWYLHASALFLELAAFERLISTRPKHRSMFGLWRLCLLAIHAMVFIGTFFLLDGGVTFNNWAGAWASGIAALSLGALVTARC